MNLKNRIIHLCFVFLASCNEPLLTGLSSSDSNKILSLLLMQGIAGEQNEEKDFKWSISVSSRDYPRALELISAVSKQSRQDLDIVDNSLFPSEESERFKSRLLVASTVQSLLEELPGVIKAKVVISGRLNKETDQDKVSNDFEAATALLTVFPTFGTSNDTIAGMISGACGIENQKIKLIVNKVPLLSDKNEQLKTSVGNGQYWWMEKTSEWQKIMIGIIAAISCIFAIRTWLHAKRSPPISRPLPFKVELE